MQSLEKKSPSLAGNKREANISAGALTPCENAENQQEENTS